MKRYFHFIALAAILFSLTARGDSQLTGDGRVLENPTSNGDMKLRVNIGGTKTDVISITGSTGAVAVGPTTSNQTHTFRSAIQAVLASGTSGGANVLANNDTGTNFVEMISWGSTRGSSSFGTTDANAAVIITEGASNIGLKIGTTTNVPVTIGANNTAGVKVNGTGKVEVAARQDGTCGIGTICSGVATSTASSPSGLDGTPSCAQGIYQRVGNAVTYGFRCTVDVTTTATSAAYRVTAPQTSTNFSGGEAHGTCTADTSTGAASVWVVESVPAAQLLNISTNNTTNTNARPVVCTVVYQLP